MPDRVLSSARPSPSPVDHDPHPNGEVQHGLITLTRKIRYFGRQAITLDLKGVQIFLGTSRFLRYRGLASSKVGLHIGYLRLSSIIGTPGGRGRRGQLFLGQCHLSPMLLLICMEGRIKLQESRHQDWNLL